MAHHAGVAIAFRQIHGFQGFAQCADLVHFHQQRVGHAFFNAFGQDFRVGDEQVVAHQLHFAAQFVGQQFPACPVVFVHAVFDGDNRVFGDQVGQIIGEFFAGVGFAFGFQVVFAVFIKFAGRAIQCEQYVFAGFVACFFGGFHHQLQGFFVAVQVGCEAAFVAHGGGEAFAVAQFFQVVEDFRAATQGFAEAVRAHGHNHEFLDVQAVVGVFAAVNHVHHGNGQRHRACAAQVAVQRQACVFRCRTGHGQGHGQGGVGTQVGFVVGAVQIQHDLVDIGLFVGVNADKGLGNVVVHVFHGFQYAFAEITRCVAVAQLQGFFLAGRCAAGHGCAAHNAAFQQNVAFNGGVAARIQNLAGENIDNGTHVLAPVDG